MLKNYLTTALRNCLRHKGYTFINVAGLAIGLACSFFILLWVRNELSYDQFHENGDRLYISMRHAYLGGNTYTWQSMPKPLTETLEADYPEVEHAILMSWEQRFLIGKGDQSYRERGYFAGPAFFEAFTFPFVLGDPQTAIDDPNAIVISEALAAKLYGEDWQEQDGILGQTLNIDRRKDFIVRGVFEDVPENSTFQFDAVLPAEDFVQRNDWVEHWGNSGMQIFVQLEEGTPLGPFNHKIQKVIQEHNEGASADAFLHPFQDIHLHSSFEEGKLVGGRIEYVRIFTIVAVFLLIIAAINFMNLATARSMQRAKEIGVRKAVGASHQSLVMQFMGEAMLIAFAAFVFAMLLVVALLPAFNGLTGKSIAVTELNPTYLLMVLGIALATGLLSGSYPAFYLSAFNPVAVLRGTLRQKRGTATLRKGLVVFQFTLSILLIVATFAVYNQIDYIRTKNLGMDRDNMIILGMEGGVRDQFSAFKEQLEQKPGIEYVTTSSQSPLNVGNSTTDPEWDGKAEDDNTLFHVINANYDFIDAMRMELVAGRDFSEDFSTDTSNVIINERTAQAMGMENPIGQRFAMWGQEGQVIGVVKDFHMSSLYAPIEPTVIRFDPEETWMVFVRAKAGETEQAVASMEELYKQFNPGYPIEYEFLDKQFEDAYQAELVMGSLANTFAGIAIFISCLGLFGLASFTTERRIKEIGIRKVLGASVPYLVMLLSMDFTKLVLISFVIAAPLAYLAVNEYLAHFEYRIDINYTIFVIAGIAAAAIAWLTVSYQSIKAARSNPVDCLRSE